MYEIKLVHPRLGICAVEMYDGNQRRLAIIYNWKYKYGKKFYECILEGNTIIKQYKGGKAPPKTDRKVGKLVLHLPTGDIYEGAIMACKGTGEKYSTIIAHIYKRFSNHFKYRFKFV